MMRNVICWGQLLGGCEATWTSAYDGYATNVEFVCNCHFQIKSVMKQVERCICYNCDEIMGPLSNSDVVLLVVHEMISSYHGSVEASG